MLPAAERIQPLAPAPTQNPSDNSSPSPLKALIIAVAAVASVVFGLWIAGFIGAVTALIAIGITAAIHLGCRKQQITAEEPLKAGDYTGALADPTLLWITGASSRYLAQMLCLCRLNKINNMETDSAGFMESLAEEPLANHYFPLGNLHSFQKATPYFVMQTLVAEQKHIQDELSTAYLLPGDPKLKTMTNPGNSEFCLQFLHHTIGKLLQRGIDDTEKRRLKQHIENNLRPIFASRETILAQLDRFVENKIILQYLRSRPCNSTDPLHLQPMVASILNLFDQVQSLPFSKEERDLINRPCPLVFASKTVNPEPYDPTEWMGRPGELAVNQPKLLFGRDLQVAYTTAPNIQRIQKVLEQFGVEVRDLKHLTTHTEPQIRIGA